ncbi:MAG: hypothetical protein JWQ23_2677 [Herminiimonas sp.]|nr:hypothetical protein [Herminiimonas sp.]
MNSFRWKPIRMAVVALAAVALTGPASAQYMWLGENGVKQYSDIPPPSSVPKSRILKQPGQASPQALQTNNTAPAEADAEKDTGSPAAKEQAAMTTAQRNAEYNKRRIEQAEKDKKAADEQKLAGERARTCDQARAYQRSLESGERLARMDRNGERFFLNDAQRAQEAAETKRILGDCGKG